MPIRLPGFARVRTGSVQALFWDYTPIVPPAGMNDQQFYRNEIPAREAGRVALKIANLPAGSYTLEIYRTGYRANDVYTSYLLASAHRRN